MDIIKMKQQQKIWEYLYRKAHELGGTIYEIAKDSGFLSAYEDRKRFPVSEEEDEKELMEGCQSIKEGMPGIYVMWQAIRVYYAENYIRRKENPRFFAERIPAAEEEFLAKKHALIEELLPKHGVIGMDWETMPSSYQKLLEQICYIRYYYEAVYRKVWTGPFFEEQESYFASQDKDLKKGIQEVAEAFGTKREYCLMEGERALVLVVKEDSLEVGFVEKQEEKLICLADAKRIDFKEEMKKADTLLIAKMKDIIDFEQLNMIGIRETDEKNKKAFEEFYGSLERIKKQFLRNDEVRVVFKNLWYEISDGMTRDEYRECMLPLYQFFSEKVQELQEKYGIDGFSKIYLLGDKSDDITLWEYLEGYYSAKLCLLNP